MYLLTRLDYWDFSRLKPLLQMCQCSVGAVLTAINYKCASVL